MIHLGHWTLGYLSLEKDWGMPHLRKCLYLEPQMLKELALREGRERKQYIQSNTIEPNIPLM